MQDRGATPEDLQAVRDIAKGFIDEIHQILAAEQNPATRAITTSSLEDILGDNVELVQSSEAEISLILEDPSKDRLDEFTPR